MGLDARQDRRSDFVKFREENRGRLSHLRGGRSFDNAMIMQINDYIFVEFSGTGNAMYYYRVGMAPFNPESTLLDIKTHLKDKGICPKPLTHFPSADDYTKHKLTGWMLKYDDELRKLGIRWMAEEPVKFIDKKRSHPPRYLMSKSLIRCGIRPYSACWKIFPASSAIIGKRWRVVCTAQNTG